MYVTKIRKLLKINDVNSDGNIKVKVHLLDCYRYPYDSMVNVHGSNVV